MENRYDHERESRPAVAASHWQLRRYSRIRLPTPLVVAQNSQSRRESAPLSKESASQSVPKLTSRDLRESFAKLLRLETMLLKTSDANAKSPRASWDVCTISLEEESKRHSATKSLSIFHGAGKKEFRESWRDLSRLLPRRLAPRVDSRDLSASRARISSVSSQVNDKHRRAALSRVRRSRSEED